MKKAFGYIIKVVYFVPLVSHQGSIGIFPKTDGRRDDSVIAVGFAVGSHMKSKSASIKTFLYPTANVGDRLSA